MKKKFTITLDDVKSRSADELEGCKIFDPDFQLPGKVGEDGDLESFTWPRLRRLWIGEALHALVAFKREHGFVPRCPRFEVVLKEDGSPQPSRHVEMLQEMEAEQAQVEEVLAR
jgi:hypothetical protein